MDEHLLPPRHRETLDNAVLMQLQTLLQRPKNEAIWDSFHLLDCVHYHSHSIGPSTAVAIHATLWPYIQSLHDENKHAHVIAWCQLALHPALSRSSPPDNTATFLRRMLSAHIALDETTAAHALFEALPATTRDNLATRVLMFRLGVRRWDQAALAHACLQFLADSGAGGRDALYACVREAQTAGDRLCTVAALTATAATWRGQDVVATHVPALLRCAIRLLQAVAAEEQAAADDAAEPPLGVTASEMVNLFHTAAEFVDSNARDDNGDAVFHAAELRWFSTNAHNLGVAHCTVWAPGLLASLFQSCLVFTQALSFSSDDDNAATDATFTIFRCHFVLASLYMSEARVVENEHTASLYADVEKHATAFTKLFTTHCGSSADKYPDLRQKLGVLCVFQFEALLSRPSYDHLPCIVQQARLCSDVNVLKALGACLVQSEAPVQAKSSLLKAIVNAIFGIEDFNSERLAQYLRCMVQVLLPMADDGAAREILDQAIQVADEAKQVGVGFPAPEAEWLAVAAFNHGLTKYAARRDMSTCHAWLDRAVAMAQHADDGGQLAVALQQRRETLINSSLTGTL